jgi:hypothetical protein
MAFLDKFAPLASGKRKIELIIARLRELFDIVPDQSDCGSDLKPFKPFRQNTAASSGWI